MSSSGFSAKQKAAAFLAGAVILVVIFGVVGAWVSIDEGSVGVEKNRGAVTGDILEPGWHMVNPATEDVVKVDTRPRTETMSGETAIPLLTGDGQDVEMDLSVRYRVEEQDADTFHSEYRDHDKALNDLIRPTVRSTSRHEASSLRANEVITKDGRTTLEDTVEQSLQRNTEGTGITIEAVQVRDVRLNEEYGTALENVEIENTKAEQRIIRAESEAEANQIRDESLTEAVLQEKYLETIDDSDKVVLATGDDGTPVILDAGANDSGSAATTSSEELAEGAEGAQNESGGDESEGDESGDA